LQSAATEPAKHRAPDESGRWLSFRQGKTRQPQLSDFSADQDKTRQPELSDFSAAQG
jgi:hypothetical protein